MKQTKENLRVKSDKAITLIALVITIIVLLILAGVTITTLTGDNGLLQKASDAKEETEIAEEKEQLKLAMASMKLENETDLMKRKTIFQGLLNNSIGENKTTVYINGNGYTVHFLSNNRVYTIDENGEIFEDDRAILNGNDNNPGELEDKGNNQLVINSIEDLVVFSKNVNNGTNYRGKTVLLERTLDFKSELSYSDISKKYSYSEELHAYVEDNSSSNTLYDLCTKNQGFIPIGISNTNEKRFAGVFDGKNNEIKNLYINSSGVAGLFGYGYYDMTASYYSNITVTGNITSKDDIAAGISATGGKFINCHNKAEITGAKGAGGICCNNATLNMEIKECSNEGNIRSYDGGAGGIIRTFSAGTISDCFNAGNIVASGKPYYSSGIDYSCPVAGIVANGGGNNIKIINCYNTGNCSSTAGWCKSGGIIGICESSKTTINNCYNTGDMLNTSIKSTAWNETSGIGAAICNNCYSIGGVESNNDKFAISGDNVNKCYYSSEINSNMTLLEENLIDISKKSGQELVDLLNSYKDDNGEYPGNWKKWVLGKKGYPVFDNK